MADAWPWPGESLLVWPDVGEGRVGSGGGLSEASLGDGCEDCRIVMVDAEGADVPMYVAHAEMHIWLPRDRSVLDGEDPQNSDG